MDERVNVFIQVTERIHYSIYIYIYFNHTIIDATRGISGIYRFNFNLLI